RRIAPRGGRRRGDHSYRRTADVEKHRRAGPVFGGADAIDALPHPGGHAAERPTQDHARAVGCAWATTFVMRSPTRIVPPVITFALMPRRCSAACASEFTNIIASTSEHSTNLPPPVCGYEQPSIT